MARGRVLRPHERLLAMALGVVWVGAGIVGLTLGVSRWRWPLALGAACAICFGIAWFVVARRARLFQSGELLRPWRAPSK